VLLIPSFCQNLGKAFTLQKVAQNILLHLLFSFTICQKYEQKENSPYLVTLATANALLASEG
jgi:hypothetical protein